MALTQVKMTLEQYLNFEDGLDTEYVLEQGELVAEASESDLNRQIAGFLFAYFLKLGIPHYRLTMKTEVVVSSLQATTRLPDLMILSEPLVVALKGARRSTVTLEMPPPLLVVEVVSPGQENRDYRYKRSEYGARGIAEYWIVDPLLQQVTVLVWVEGFYGERVYQGQEPMGSALLGSLALTTIQVLQEG